MASYLRDRADVSGLEVSQGFLVVANLSIASNSLMCSSLFRYPFKGLVRLSWARWSTTLLPSIPAWVGIQFSFTLVPALL